VGERQLNGGNVMIHGQCILRYNGIRDREITTNDKNGGRKEILYRCIYWISGGAVRQDIW